MKKVIIETDSNKDAIKLINVDKFIYALEELKKYRRSLCKGYENDICYLTTDNEIITLKEVMLSKDIKTKGSGFIYTGDIIDSIDDILSEVEALLYEIE